MTGRLVVTVGAVLGSMTLLGAQDGRSTEKSIEDFVGRWNIHILTAEDSFHCAWLKVELVDDAPRGSLLWKWGSPGNIQDISVEGGELVFRRGGMKLRARIVDGLLIGNAVEGRGAKHEFKGWPATELCDVTGTWKVAPVEDPSLEGSLVLEQKDDKITGKATDAEGSSYEIRDAKLDGYRLSFTVVAKAREGERKVSCEIRGDLLVGHVEVPVPGQADREIPIRGKRERVWGKPVVLLKEQSLEGWGPRDPKRNFGWTIQDGILENGPKDVDIMSEKEFHAFRLHVEYKVAANNNSGIYLRGQYELQVLGRAQEKGRESKQGNMAVYGRLSPAGDALKGLDEWQTVEVTLIGRWVTVVLNGETVHDNQYLEGPTGGGIVPREEDPGPIILQGDHGKVRFRNVTVTPGS